MRDALWQPTFMLSPSVQDWNVGYGDFGTEEQRMNQIADVVAYELDRNGLTLVRNDPSQTLQEIVAQSNAISPKIHVAIHSNASANGKARGRQFTFINLAPKVSDLQTIFTTSFWQSPLQTGLVYEKGIRLLTDRDIMN